MWYEHEKIGMHPNIKIKRPGGPLPHPTTDNHSGPACTLNDMLWYASKCYDTQAGCIKGCRTLCMPEIWRVPCYEQLCKGKEPIMSPPIPYSQARSLEYRTLGLTLPNILPVTCKPPKSIDPIQEYIWDFLDQSGVPLNYTISISNVTK